MFHKNQAPKTRNMMRYWMRQETLRLRTGIAVAACFLFVFILSPFSIRHPLTAASLLLRIAVIFLIILGANLLCRTKFAVKHSFIGKQIARFGDFDAVYSKVCAAAQAPLYTNGTEVISEEYIFLMPEMPNAPQTAAFAAPAKLLILGVNELERVSVKPNAPYPDEMNTLLFRTAHAPKGASLDNRLYTMTVHMNTESAQALAAAITEKMQAANPAQDIPAEEYYGFTSSEKISGNFRKTSAHGTFSSDTDAFNAASEEYSTNARTTRANTYPYRSRRTPAARAAARFRSNPLKELRAGKMRVFRLVVFLIVFVNVGAMLFVYFLSGKRTLSAIPHDFIQFIRRELIARPDQLLFLLILLAIYLIPTVAIYLRIQHWYRQFLAEYEKLPQTEQKELLEKLCDNFETGCSTVIYTKHVFCFRNLRSLSFQTLLPYSCVLWIYRTRTAFSLPSAAPGIEQSVDFYHLIIRTADRRKYRIASSDEPMLARRAPDAVVGYGDIQRETYLDLVRERKGH